MPAVLGAVCCAGDDTLCVGSGRPSNCDAECVDVGLGMLAATTAGVRCCGGGDAAGVANALPFCDSRVSPQWSVSTRIRGVSEYLRTVHLNDAPASIVD